MAEKGQLKTSVVLEVPADARIGIRDFQEVKEMPGATVTYDKNTGKVKIEIDPEEAKKTPLK